MNLAGLFASLLIAANPYPEEITKLVEGLNPIICELEQPRKVGVKVYRKEKERWLVRIFMKNGNELEIWLNYQISAAFPRLSLMSADKVFYNTSDGWVNKNSISQEKANELDKRLKFTTRELTFLSSCFKKKFK